VDVYLHRAEEERGHVPQANAQPEGRRVLEHGVVRESWPRGIRST
jgi:hypothetical protein